jgi:hypothetical protein
MKKISVIIIIGIQLFASQMACAQFRVDHIIATANFLSIENMYQYREFGPGPSKEYNSTDTIFGGVSLDVNENIVVTDSSIKYSKHVPIGNSSDYQKDFSIRIDTNLKTITSLSANDLLLTYTNPQNSDFQEKEKKFITLSNAPFSISSGKDSLTIFIKGSEFQKYSFSTSTYTETQSRWTDKKLATTRILVFPDSAYAYITMVGYFPFSSSNLETKPQAKEKVNCEIIGKTIKINNFLDSKHKILCMDLIGRVYNLPQLICDEYSTILSTKGLARGLYLIITNGSTFKIWIS